MSEFKIGDRIRCINTTVFPMLVLYNEQTITNEDEAKIFNYLMQKSIEKNCTAFQLVKPKVKKFRFELDKFEFQLDKSDYTEINGIKMYVLNFLHRYCDEFKGDMYDFIDTKWRVTMEEIIDDN